MRGDARDMLGRAPRQTFEQDILTPARAGMSGLEDGAEAETPLEERPGYALPPRFGTGAAVDAGAAPEASNSNWDGVERRKADAGPPKGQPERRRAHLLADQDHLGCTSLKFKNIPWRISLKFHKIPVQTSGNFPNTQSAIAKVLAPLGTCGGFFLPRL